jgi:hypothetical protein
MRVEQNAKPKNRRLSIETVKTIRDLSAQGISRARLSERFKMSPSHIGSIVRREVYKDAP